MQTIELLMESKLKWGGMSDRLSAKEDVEILA